MKNSIKSRMEVLLEQEIDERARTDPSTITGQTSQTGQTSSTTEASGEREETKADILFNTDNGEQFVVLRYFFDCP